MLILVLDLNDPNNYRDLSKPIGAINHKKLNGLKKNLDSDIPMLYPHHYSYTYIVLYYIMRTHPLYFLNFQGTAFGSPDRLFFNMKVCWMNVFNPGSDVNELIPEFYNSDGSFLKNIDKLNLGTTQSGHIIDDVILPKWAKSPEDFVKILRAALESDIVSSKLNEWIDLIFGYKQSGEQALEADNLFHYFSYDDYDYMNNINEDLRESYVTHLLECGQTPRKLFYDPHPKKRSRTYFAKLDTNKFQNELIIQINKLLREREQIEKHNERLRRTKEYDIEAVHEEFKELEKKQNEEYKSLNE